MLHKYQLVGFFFFTDLLRPRFFMDFGTVGFCLYFYIPYSSLNDSLLS